jgi:flavin-binding protein dodecin
MAKKKITGSSTKSIEQAIENALGFGTLEARSGPDPDKGETFRLTQTTVEVGTISGGHTYEVTLKSP